MIENKKENGKQRKKERKKEKKTLVDFDNDLFSCLPEVG